MTEPASPDAMLFLSSHCPHCPGMLQALAELVKLGRLGRLEVVNLEVRPHAAQELGVRSVPWIRLGPFELSGARGRAELEDWIDLAARPEGMATYFHTLLREGALPQVLQTVHRRPDTIHALLPIVADPEASINVRLGAGAVFEEFTAQPTLQAITHRLGELAQDEDPRVRADACHYLSLTRSHEARPYLVARLQDDDAAVREIARESLGVLGGEPTA
jgi:hypothetical protein